MKNTNTTTNKNKNHRCGPRSYFNSFADSFCGNLSFRG